MGLRKEIRQRRPFRSAAEEAYLALQRTAGQLEQLHARQLRPWGVTPVQYNALRILRGEQFIDLIPERFRNLMLHKNVTRLVKSADGSGHFETISDPNEVIKLAARPGAFDLAEEYGVPAKLVEALDITTQLAMAAGLDALREAGIPLVQTWKRTTTGKFLPERWMLPEALLQHWGTGDLKKAGV